MPTSRPRRPVERNARTCRIHAHRRGAFAPGNRKPVAGKAAGRAMRAVLLAGVAVFRRGDEACFHRNAGPGGRLDCASRFRFGPTHSLLLRRHLGRNLITVFSTVNTPREKNGRTSTTTTRARRFRRGAHGATTDARVARRLASPRNETSFFKRFSPRAVAARGFLGARKRRRWRRREAARGGMNDSVSARARSGGFSRRTSPIARNCANPNPESATVAIAAKSRARRRRARSDARRGVGERAR